MLDTLKQKRNVIFCDGGLSNRLNALIFALILKEKYRHKWELSWPVNNWCRASFQSLFSINISTNKNELTSYKKIENDYCLVMHENQCGFTDKIINFQSNLHNYADYEKLLSDKKPVFYYHNLIPKFVTFSEIQSGLSQLSIQREIHARASGFCMRNQIDDSVLGLHIRKTDFGNTVDDNELFNVVKSSRNRFFVCSDDESVENNFSYLHNVVTFKKTMYVEKLNPNSDWNGNITDSEGRSFRFNVNRNRVSVIESFIDLLILSRNGNRLVTSESSFLKFSENYSQINIF